MNLYREGVKESIQAYNKPIPDTKTLEEIDIRRADSYSVEIYIIDLKQI